MNDLDPINVVEDFNVLMGLGNESFDDSSQSVDVKNLSGSDKENNSATLILNVEDDDVECLVAPVTRRQTRLMTRNNRAQTRRSAKVKKPNYQTEQIVIGSDDEDDVGKENPRINGHEGNRWTIQLDVVKDRRIAASQEIITIDDDDDPNPSIPKNKISNYSLEADILNALINVKVKWMFEGGMSFKLRRFQPFKHIYHAIAKEKKMNVEYILLSKNDVQIRHSDTPETIDLSVVDILSGEILSHSVTFSNDVKINNDANSITVTVMTQSVRHNKKMFTIGKHQNMYVLFVKVAEQLECSVDDVMLWFDGEKISPGSTVDDVELEGGECIEMKCKTKANVDWYD